MLPTLLLTRPSSEAQVFLARVRAEFDHPVSFVISPVLEIRPADTVVPKFQRAVLTSVQAVKVLGNRLDGRMVWCVGREVARLAQALGASVVLVAETAAELVAAGVDLRDAVYFRGAHVSRDLAGELGLEEVVLYYQEARALSDDARTLLASGTAVVAPVFSRRSARILVTQVENWPPHVHIIAISAAVAAEFPSSVRSSVLAAPEADEMVKAVVAALKEQA